MPLSSGSRDTISADVAVAHGKGSMAGIAKLDDPPCVVGGVVSSRDDAAFVALVGLFGWDALCVVLSKDDGVCAGPRGPMSLALDFPARGARRTRTLTCEGWSRVVVADCVTGSANSTPREKADALTGLSIVIAECDDVDAGFPAATDPAVPAGTPA